MENANFGRAIEWARDEGAFRLPEWSEEAVIRMQVPDDRSKMTEPYLYVESRYGLIPWIPTMIEILSKRWVLIEL